MKTTRQRIEEIVNPFVSYTDLPDLIDKLEALIADVVKEKLIEADVKRYQLKRDNQAGEE